MVRIELRIQGKAPIPTTKMTIGQQRLEVGYTFSVAEVIDFLRKGNEVWIFTLAEYNINDIDHPQIFSLAGSSKVLSGLAEVAYTLGFDPQHN